MPMTETFGICACGCGQRTRLAPCTDSSKGWVRGKPLTYLHRHSRVGGVAAPRVGGVPLAYEVTDCGYKTPCWLWQGVISRSGYAVYAGRRVHRLTMALAGIDIPEGTEPDHLCGVKHCVRPEHCEPVSHTENIRRCSHTILNADDVRLIRARLDTGESQAAIGKDFGCHQVNISRIKTGKSWKDVR